MITQMMVQPSFWVDSGIKLSKVRDIHLKYTISNLQLFDTIFWRCSQIIFHFHIQ
jgi:hypothetical protein